jgi:hypothetical protein
MKYFSGLLDGFYLYQALANKTFYCHKNRLLINFNFSLPLPTLRP